MRIHKLTLSELHFSWVSRDKKKKKERLICEAFLRIRMPAHEGNIIFETPPVDPPDVIIKLSDGKSLAVEVTEYVPYERRPHAQADKLLKALRGILDDWNVSPSEPCNVVLGFRPELERNISQRRLLNQVEQLGLKIKEFFETTDISHENRILKIFDGDVSITFVPALGHFGAPLRNYHNNLNVTCWDGILLERTPNDIRDIVAKKNETLRKALAEKGKQSQTDVLIIWSTMPLEEPFLLDIQLLCEYSGLYYLFIMNVVGKEGAHYIAGLETIRETANERAFFGDKVIQIKTCDG